MKQQHFLLVPFPAQGHINPSLQLAKRLTRTGARVTFSTTVSAHRRMFPASPTSLTDDHESLLYYSPFSDGYDDGLGWNGGDFKHYMSQLKTVGLETLSHLARSLAAQGHPVTCIIYTTAPPWVSDLARDLDIPSVYFWTQPATVFSIYYHYFHGYGDVIAAQGKDPSSAIELPGLPRLQTRDLPSFLISKSDEGLLFARTEELFRRLDETAEADGKGSKLRVLVNSFDALEHDVFKAATDYKLDLIPIGPLVPSACIDGTDPTDTALVGDLQKPDSKDYMKWLESKPDRSVVYVSFGSISMLPRPQREEISRALVESGRPYLWVVRGEREGVVEGEEGMVVEWCSQAAVLSHRSVGCFVTHCGWNSMVESMACGVPTVGLPQWSDQTTNAKMAGGVGGVGVRAEVNEERLLEARELRRCLDLIMGEGELGAEITKSARL